MRWPAVAMAAACLLPALAGGPRAAHAAGDLRDPTFAGHGTVVLDLGGDDGANAVTVDGDGRIVVAATTRDRAPAERVVTIEPGGEADPRQATRIELGPGTRVRAVAAGRDGMLLVGGVTAGDRRRAFVARLLPDGRRDRSFVAALPAQVAGARDDAAVHALAADASSRVVVAGRAGAGAFVARLASDGALDPGFASGGVATIALPRRARVVAAAVAPDGSAAFVAEVARAESAPFVLRTNPDGAPDHPFGHGGVVELAIDRGVLAPRSVALDAASGGVVVAGTLAGRGGDRAVLLRLTRDGSRDATLGAGGLLDTTSTGADVAAAVAVQPDGRIVAAGTLGTGAARDVAVARFAAAAARCGDGIVAAGEQCDDGDASARAGSCCSATCTLLAAGTPCRPADGACDEAEQCDGRSARCPDDAFARAGVACRAAAGACDVAEVCSGTAPACPANDVRPRGTVCRIASGACDLDEECDGVSGECPPDAKRTGECRASRGGCDPAEWCDGASGDCPTDVVRPDGAACDDGDACTSGDVCVGDVCRGGARDDFACAGYLCSRMHAKRLLSGEPPRPADMRALGLEVQVEGARAVCRPAVATADAVAGEATPRGDDADTRAADAADDRVSYVAYKVTPIARRRARATAPRLVSALLEDRFGTLELAPKQVRLVSLPALVGAAEAADAPGGTAYQCQQITPGAVLGSGARPLAVRVVGEPEAERFAVGRPVRVCHPVDAGLDAGDEDEARVCYELHRLGLETAASRGPLLVGDAFQTMLVGALGEPQLCVPALLVRAEWDDAQAKRGRRGDREPRKPHRRRSAHERRPHGAPPAPRDAGAPGEP